MKRKTKDADDKIPTVRSQTLQLLGSDHALERIHKRRQLDRKLGVVKQPTNILQGIGNRLKKMRLAFIETAEAICTHRLNDAHVNVCVIPVHERIALQINTTREDLEITIQQQLPQFRRQIGLRIVQQRRDVILQRAFAPALVIDKQRLLVPEHNVARLEVSI